MIYYQYRADRARRTLRGIDEQVAKAAKAVAGLAPVKRNRFIALDGAAKSVNRELEAKATGPGRAEGLRHQPRRLPRRHPGHRGLRDRQLPRALEHREELPHVKVRPAGPARSTTASATPSRPTSRSCSPPSPSAGSSRHRTGWSIRKFVRTARRYRTIQIQRRPAHPHRRRPAPARPPRRPRPHQVTRGAH